MSFSKAILLLGCSVCLAAGACDNSTTGSVAQPTAQPTASSVRRFGKVLATVNGAAITDLDVALRAKKSGHEKGKKQPAPVNEKGVLETLIREELAAQKAKQLGLTPSPAYHKTLEQMQVEVAAFKRKAMADAFLSKELKSKGAVSDDEAKKYFDGNRERVGTELHILQLLHKRNPKSAQAALAEIRSGTSFEDVAKKRFPKLPEGSKPPWDLGYLRWHQVPEAWWDVVFLLKKGQVSGLISDKTGRNWILKLVDKRLNPNASFSTMKPRVKALLEKSKAARLREQTNKALRAGATIVYGKQGNKATAPSSHPAH